MSNTDGNERKRLWNMMIDCCAAQAIRNGADPEKVKQAAARLKR